MARAHTQITQETGRRHAVAKHPSSPRTRTASQTFGSRSVWPQSCASGQEAHRHSAHNSRETKGKDSQGLTPTVPLVSRQLADGPVPRATRRPAFPRPVTVGPGPLHRSSAPGHRSEGAGSIFPQAPHCPRRGPCSQKGTGPHAGGHLGPPCSSVTEHSLVPPRKAYRIPAAVPETPGCG